MCGIVGFIGTANEAELAEGVAAIGHRGPDGSGHVLLADGKVGFGHTRLSIIDLSSAGSQPMVDDATGVVLTFNGEIYNFRELQSELRQKEHEFKSSSDTEVVLRAYLEFGTEMFSRLNGIFALAIWDPRVDEVVICRDHFGVKPLYFSKTDSVFCFSSEIKGLSPFLVGEVGPDIGSLALYPSFVWAPGGRTPDLRIRQLDPGCFLRISSCSCETERPIRQHCWYPAFVPVYVRQDFTETEAIAELRDHLRRAVHRQMVADVPVGAFLSGGLDSSAIVAQARELNSDIQCFTINARFGSSEGFADDLPYAQKVAKHLNVPLHIVDVSADDFRDELPNMIAMLEEPLADPAALSVTFISRLARQMGTKVLLSGVGGDDLLSGYRRHLAINVMQKLDWIPSPLLHLANELVARSPSTSPFARRLSKLLGATLQSADRRVEGLFRWLPEHELTRLFCDDFRSTATETLAQSPIGEFLASMPDNMTPLQRVLAVDQRFFLTDHNLLYTDKMSMATGVEVRVPFLDVDLFEWSRRVPDHMKQRGNIGKWLLKKAMEPVLPRSVIHRPKTGFGFPVREWITGELHTFVTDTLSPNKLRDQGIFDPKAIEELVHRNRKGEIDASYSILSLVCIQQWFTKFGMER